MGKEETAGTGNREQEADVESVLSLAGRGGGRLTEAQLRTALYVLPGREVLEKDHLFLASLFVGLPALLLGHTHDLVEL